MVGRGHRVCRRRSGQRPALCLKGCEVRVRCIATPVIDSSWILTNGKALARIDNCALTSFGAVTKLVRAAAELAADKGQQYQV